MGNGGQAVPDNLMFTKEQYDQYYNERFIYQSEYQQVIDIIERFPEYRILIKGRPGTGKSTFLHILNQRTAEKKPNEIIHGYHIFEDYSNLNLSTDCVFIDGLDEFIYSKSLFHYLSTKKISKLICTSRPLPFIDNGGYFTHIINLEPSDEQIQSLIYNTKLQNIIKRNLLSDKVISTPRDLLKFAFLELDDTNIKDFYKQNREFSYQYGLGFDVNSSSIWQPDPEIIVPSKEIITNVNILNDTLLKKAKKDPRIIHDFTPREFEEMICEFLDEQGYKVELTKQTKDGGKDLIVVQKSMIGDFCIYVECKKYDVHRPIGVSLVRELYGSIMADDVTAGMMITTSYFSNDAKDYTKKIQYRMTLMDYNDLVKAIAQMSK